ncbi:MAG TPA: hypothetical protein VGI39_36120, partial [Polyangiaceae bacterium]
SISLYPIARCYHCGQIPDGAADALVLGYAALPEHDFERGITALGELLDQELQSAVCESPRARTRPP